MTHGFHAHIYFDAASRPAAEKVRCALGREFDLYLGALEESVFDVDIAPQQFAIVVSWLMLNRNGLSVLVYPRWGSVVTESDAGAFWMGDALPIDIEHLRRSEKVR